MSKPQQPAQPQPMTRGSHKALPCPWCARPNDLTDMADYALEVGADIECDHCKKLMRIARVEPVTVIFVRPVQGRPRGF